MKKEMKIVLPFYKIAYAVSFVVILSLISAVVLTQKKIHNKEQRKEEKKFNIKKISI